MKIIQVAPYYFPALGGVEEVVKQYSEGLVRKGHQVSVFTSPGPGPVNLNGVGIKRLRLDTLVTQLVSQNPDLLHLHANKALMTDISSFINLFKKFPMVFNPHAGQFGTSFLGRLHNKTIGKMSFVADLVLTVSEFEKDLLLKAGIKPKRLEVLPNGVNSEEFKRERKNPFANSSIKGRGIVLYVGRLNFNKNLDTLVRALKNLPGLVLFLVGPDAGEKAALEGLIRDLDLKTRVFILGALSREEVIGAYQHADIFCLPSRNEAFGLVILEAMAAGLPVIASDLAVFKELIREGKNGLLFEVGNEKALSEKLLRLTEDLLLGKRLVEGAKEIIKEKYEWESIITKLENYYQSIAIKK